MKQETIEQAFKYWSDKQYSYCKSDIINFCAKWQQERSYSEQEVKKIINDIVEKHCTYFEQNIKNDIKLEWFEIFKNK